MTRISDFVANRTPPQLYETYLVPGLFRPWTEELIADAPKDGAFLDLACGTGIVSRLLAMGRPARQITAVDVAPLMIALAERMVASEGLAGSIDFQLASADDLPFSDARFDAAFCQQGIQFFPDKKGALSEVHRVLKPDGALTAAVWTGAADGNPVFEAFERSVERHLGADLVPTGPFAFGDRDRFREPVEAAGFEIQTLERREKTVVLPDVETFVLFDILFLGRPGADGSLQPALDPEDPAGDAIVARMIDEMGDALRPFVRPDGQIEAPMAAHVIKATA